jgi:autotransporter-associated beta strand protein
MGRRHVFSAGGKGTGTFGVNVGAVTANSITVNQGVPTFTNGTITLAGTEGLAQAGYITLNVPATINSTLAGSIGMTKSGSSTLTLGGASSYTGPTTINAGTLQIGAAAPRGRSIPPAPSRSTAPFPSTVRTPSRKARISAPSAARAS